MDIFAKVYNHLFPTLFCGDDNACLPQSFRKMLSVTIKGQKIKCGQVVLTRRVFPFSCTSTTSPLSHLRTVFSDPDIRPAKIHFFFVHTIQISNTEFTSKCFAYVKWPMHHPLHSSIGKPYEVWCSSLYKNSPENRIVPIENVVSLMLTAQQTFEEENVLVTVPLVL